MSWELLCVCKLNNFIAIISRKSQGEPHAKQKEPIKRNSFEVIQLE